jgi:hypothetical protein
MRPEAGLTQVHLGKEQEDWMNLPKGVYFLSARLNGQLLSKKLIKF